MKSKLSQTADLVNLDSETAKDVHKLMENNSDSFYQKFYSEQLKMQKQHKNGRRFHPDIIRWVTFFIYNS